VSLAQSAFAQIVPVNIATIWVDGSGNGSRTLRQWHDENHDFIPQCDLLKLAANGECGASSFSTPVSFTVGADPGPGGLGSALIYTPPSSFGSTTQGDVVLYEGGSPSDVIRFNGNRTLVFYSTLLPVSLYGNTVPVNKLSPWTVYIPQSGQPGFGYINIGLNFIGNYLTYAFHYPTPEQVILNLANATASVDFQQGERLLLSALANLNDGSVTAACGQLDAFNRQAQAQTGKSLTNAQANQLILSATGAMTAIGCQ
jgi:hypothetical protein